MDVHDLVSSTSIFAVLKLFLLDCLKGMKYYNNLYVFCNFADK
jgi:hypothetical protein